MSGEAVLIFEPDPAAEVQLNAVLTEAGHQVYAADSVDAVLHALRATPFPLVFVDAAHARPSVEAVARRAAELQPDTMVIFTGDEAALPHVLGALRGGAADFVTRPFVGPAVGERVNAAIEQRRRQRARLKSLERRARAAEHALGQAEIGSGAHASTIELMQGFADFALETFVSLERRNLEVERRLRQFENPGATEERPVLSAWVAHSDADFAAGVVTLGPKLRLEIAHPMSTGGEVLDKITDRPPQLLILDASLPDIPGELLVQTVRAEWPELEMVVIEGWGTEAREVLVVAGAAPEVRRPMKTVQDLIEMMELAADRATDAKMGRDFAEAFKGQHEEFIRRFAEVKKSLGQR